MEPATVDDWAEVQELERISRPLPSTRTVRGVMGDLDYGSVFALPYWTTCCHWLKDADRFALCSAVA